MKSGATTTRLQDVLAFIRTHGAGSTAHKELHLRGTASLKDTRSDLPQNEQRTIEKESEELRARGVYVITALDATYPEQLRDLKRPPPFLFLSGNVELLTEPGVGMCGSRKASQRGLEAARSCGTQVGSHGLHVISGYAKGVDTETHLAALTAGAGTVIVLAEGIKFFRKKRAFDAVPFDANTVLVISQFAPSQRWTPGAAMERNGTIAALGRALIVIEAGETGGTLNAGKQGLDIGRPVIALEFSGGMPAGNRRLFEAGAAAVGTPRELSEALAALGASDAPPQQLTLGASK
jgi:DNA processing protein